MESAALVVGEVNVEDGARKEHAADGPRVAAVVLAGGSGVRAGASRNKVYLPLAGRTVAARSLSSVTRLAGLRRLVLVIRPEDHELALDVVRSELGDLPVPVELVPGGATRHDSEDRALAQLSEAIRSADVDIVLIHDAARPLASPRLADRVVRAATEFGGAVPGLPDDDLVQIGANGGAQSMPPGVAYVRVQTPQAFAARPLLAAYSEAAKAGFTGTDTESCVARFSDLRVTCVAGEPENIKITHAIDFQVAEQILLQTRRATTR